MLAEFVARRTAGHALARGLLPPPSCRAAGLAFRSSRISQHPVCRAGNSQGRGCLGGACSWQFLFVSCRAWGSTSALRRGAARPEEAPGPAGGGTGPGWRTWSRQLHLPAFSSRIQCEIRIPHHLSRNFEPWPQQHVRAARPCSALCKELQLRRVQLLASSLGTVSFDVQPHAPALQPSGCVFWEQIYRLLICLPPSRLDVAVIRLRFRGVSET